MNWPFLFQYSILLLHMDENKLHALKFPIGKFQLPKESNESEIKEWISILHDFPTQLKSITSGLTTEQLQWHYRPDGWSIKQVVHHCADSHMNSIVRFKLALTEDVPTIRLYEQGKWAALSDSLSDDINPSLKIIEGVHHRLVHLLTDLDLSNFDKTFIHPEMNKELSIAQNTALYAWHSRHHYAHIEQALNNKGEF